MDINLPILMDNKDLREANPIIKEHFDACEKEMGGFTKIDGIIRDDNIVDIIPCSACHLDKSQQLLVKWGGRYDECKACGQKIIAHIYSYIILH